MQTMQSNREGDNYGGSSLSTRFKNRFKILNKKKRANCLSKYVKFVFLFTFV